MLKTFSITITGKVQGVFFRQSTRDIAKSLNITGQVKNLPDGSVEIIATGTPENLYHLVEWCKHGPPHAEVSGVHFEELPLAEFGRFAIVAI
jgi:acylphosphatase